MVKAPPRCSGERRLGVRVQPPLQVFPSLPPGLDGTEEGANTPWESSTNGTSSFNTPHPVPTKPVTSPWDVALLHTLQLDSGFQPLAGANEGWPDWPEAPSTQGRPTLQSREDGKKGLYISTLGVSTTDRRYLQAPEGTNAALITSRTGRAAERGPGLRAVWFPHAVPPACPLENTDPPMPPPHAQ